MKRDNPLHPARLYDTSARALVWDWGRGGVGDIIALGETDRKPLFGIRLSEHWKLMLRADKVVAYQAERVCNH